MIGASSSLFLLGALGVEGDEQVVVWNIGWAGTICIGFVFLINMIMLIRVEKEHLERGVDMNENEDKRNVRSMSTGEMQDNMLFAAVI